MLSLSFLRNKIPPQFQSEFVQDIGLCLDCGGPVVEEDEESCCSKCGRVWSDGVKVENHTIPFESSSTEEGHSESHFSPTSELAFGKALGPGLDGRGLFRILAQGKNGNTDLPLRAMQIRLITSKLDHPTTQTALGYTSALLKSVGMHTNEESNVLFANMLGKHVRKLAAYYVVRGENGGELRRIVSALFYVFYAPVHPNEAQKLFEELALTPELVHFTQNLISLLECPPRKPRRKPIGKEEPKGD